MILTGHENDCQLVADPAGTSRRVGYVARVLVVVNRFQVSEGNGDRFRADVQAALAALAEQAGHLGGTIGRNLDEPTLWTLVTRWEHVGAYRRALSSYDVKLRAVPLLSSALDEPSAFEVVEPDTVLNIESTRSLP
jgi:quinol monooxygenase YgiN